MIRIATRASRLALWQAGFVGKALESLGERVELVPVETQGDREAGPFASLEGSGFFTKAVQEAVLGGVADIAVHSYKDLPSLGPPGLRLAAVPCREDPRDVLLVRADRHMSRSTPLPLEPGAVVGTSASRRKAQLRLARPDLDVRELRGNVPTRVDRLRAGEYDAIVLAYAGIARLRLDTTGLVVVGLAPSVMMPAPAQGALAVESREAEPRLDALLSQIDDRDARLCTAAERRLMAYFDAGCQLALGALAKLVPEGVELEAWFDGAKGRQRHPTPEGAARLVHSELTHLTDRDTETPAGSRVVR